MSAAKSKEQFMALYARSDLMSVSIPVTSGGCGEVHSRPVSHGAPVKVWKLTCEKGCESYLRGDRKPKIIRTTAGDKDKGIPGKVEHVPDADPMWSTSREGIPLTPDEEKIYSIRAEQGKQQLDTLSAFAALRSSGMEIPPQAQWLIDKILKEIAGREMGMDELQGQVLCTYGHENSLDSKFCTECGTPVAPKAIAPKDEESDEEPSFDLSRLHVATLRKMAREKKLDDKGSKQQLIARLN